MDDPLSRTTAVPQLTARQLRKLRRSLGPSGCGLLAADLADGKVAVRGLTTGQAALLAGASVGYAHTGRQLSRRQRAAVESGHAKLRHFW
jgi:hypothetical protein